MTNSGGCGDDDDVLVITDARLAWIAVDLIEQKSLRDTVNRRMDATSVRRIDASDKPAQAALRWGHLVGHHIEKIDDDHVYSWELIAMGDQVYLGRPTPVGAR